MADKLFGQHIDRDPREILEQFRLMGQQWAETKAQYEYLDDMKKVMFARICDTLRITHDKASETKLEKMALATKEYSDYIENLRQVRHQSLTKEAAYRAEEKRVEMLRSLESTSRAQMSM